MEIIYFTNHKKVTYFMYFKSKYNRKIYIYIAYIYIPVNYKNRNMIHMLYYPIEKTRTNVGRKLEAMEFFSRIIQNKIEQNNQRLMNCFLKS